MATNSLPPTDAELLADLQKLQSQVSQGQDQNPVFQVLAAAQLDALCLGFMRQREALFARKGKMCYPGESNRLTSSDLKIAISYAERIIHEATERMEAGIAGPFDSGMVQNHSNALQIKRELLNLHEQIDAEITAVDQRIARYRALADRILNGLESPIPSSK